MQSLPFVQLPEDIEAMCQLAIKNGWLTDIKGDSQGAAFPKRNSNHAGMIGAPVVETEQPALLTSLHSKARCGSSVAYVHLPYCESKCLYCVFFGGGAYSKKIGADTLRAFCGN